MSSIALVSWIIPAQAQDRSHISELLIVSQGGQDILLASTRHDGHLSSWDITGPMRAIDDVDYRGGSVAGSTGALSTLYTSQGLTVISSGGNANSLQTHTVASNGQLGTPKVFADTARTVFGAMNSFETVILSSGNQMVYGGIGSGSGIGCLTFSPTGALLRANIMADTSASHAGSVVDTTYINIGGTDYLISASGGSDIGVSTWAIRSNGQLQHVASIAPDTGLWVSDPTSLTAVHVDGVTYVVLASAGSNSLTVLEVSPQGQMTITDHLLDDRDSRFEGVTDLKTLEHHGKTYVIVGGADDGISLFVLMPNGQLVARGHIEDTTAMGLENVSAIEARSSGNGIDIFVASSSEDGITRLRFETGIAGSTRHAGTAGGTLHGTAGTDMLIGAGGADVLFGDGGDDIIRDGDGADILTGGLGADTFIFDFDTHTDTIRDFTLGEDHIDLSNWPGLRSLNQLGLEMRPDGLLITYGTERLIVQSANGAPINPATLTNADLLGSVRLPTEITAGFASPSPVTPDLPDAQLYIAPIFIPSASPFVDRNTVIQSQITGGSAQDTIAGTDTNNIISGLGGHDTLSGLNGHDVLIGGTGFDRLNGNNGNDVLFGDAGHDRLAGGNGDDQLLGGAHNDRLYGGRGDDEIFGDTGNDWINGGIGEDSLIGGDGEDVIIGNRGNDQIDGAAGRDVIFGGGENDIIYAGDGHDYVNGSTGSDRIYAGNGNDLIKGHTSADVIYGGRGNDNLFGEIGNDRLYGDEGTDYLAGGVGNDALYGGDDNDKLYGQSGADTLDGGAGNDYILGGSSADRIFGGNGQDRLYGQVGNDRLFGGSGSDYINGGAGNDVMTGADGRDVFVFTEGADIITDFDDRYDRLQIDSDLWTGSASPSILLGRYGNIQHGDTVLDFGNGHVLTLDGVTDLSSLISQIDII